MNAQTLRDLLIEETNILLYGPPGTGKTHLAQEVASLLENETAVSAAYFDTSLEQGFFRVQTEPRCKVFWVTFHQSYTYDNFVIGLRPDMESNSLLGLKPEAGVLLQAAAYASVAEHSSLIVIDEINRGNVGQILGDFITIMEPDKRLTEDGNPTPSTVYVTLPYVGQGGSLHIDLGKTRAEVQNPFAMPRKLYTLATMNSIDRSAAPLDAAIRRRFRVVHLGVDREAIASALGLEAQSIRVEDATLDSPANIKILAAYLLEQLNIRIEWFLGRDFQLGAWYLGPLAQAPNVEEAVNALANIWSGRVWPQLEESFALRPDQLLVLLKADTSGPTDVLRVSSPPDLALDVGALPVPRFDTSARPDEIGQALVSLATRLAE